MRKIKKSILVSVLAALLLVCFALGLCAAKPLGATAAEGDAPTEEPVTIKTMAEVTIGDNNLEQSAVYPKATDIYGSLDVVVGAGVTAMRVIYKQFSMGKPGHDEVIGYFVLTPSDGSLSYRNGEGTLVVDKLEEKQAGEGWHAEYHFKTPDREYDSMYFRVECDGNSDGTVVTNYSEYYIPEPEGADKTALGEQISAAEQIDTTLYRADSLAAFTAALDKAKALFSDEEATQSRVDDAATALQNAISALVLKTDKTALTALVEKMTDADKTAYTADSVQALESAVAVAQTVCDNAQATGEEIAAAESALTDAFAHLVFDAEDYTLFNEVTNKTVSGNDNTYDGSVPFYAGATVTVDMSFCSESSVSAITIIARNFAAGNGDYHDKSRGFIRIQDMSAADISGWQKGEGANLVHAQRDSDGVYHVIFTFALAEADAVTNHYLFLESSGGSTTFTSIKEYIATADIPAPPEYVPYVSADFDHETAESLKYFLSLPAESMLVDEDNGAISGQSVMLNGNGNIQPNLVMPKNADVVVSLKVKLSRSVTEFVAIGRNFAPDTQLNDTSRGYVRLRGDNGTITAFEAGEGAAILSKEVVNGVCNLSFRFRTSDDAQVKGSYVFLGTTGGSVILDDLVISLEKQEAEEFSGTLYQSENFAQGGTLFDSAILKPENAQLVGTISEGAATFTFDGELLNVAEKAFLETKAVYPKGEYQITMKIKEEGFARFNLRINKAYTSTRLYSCYFLPKSCAVIDEGVNVGRVERIADGDGYVLVTLTFNADCAWYLRGFAYQDNLSRTEGHHASFSLKDFVVQTTLSDDMKGLADAYNESTAITGGYTASSLQALRTAEEQAFAVLDGTSDELSAALSALQTAKTGLVALADMSELNAQIQRAEALDENAYYAEEWPLVTEKLAAAKALTGESAQSEIDAAKTALEQAIDALVEIPDKSALNALIAQAEGYAQADYDTASFEALSAALQQAKEAVDKNKVTKAEIASATSALSAAIEGLKQAPKGCGGSLGGYATLALLGAMTAAVAVILLKQRRKS